jgi:hypothetical protein
MIVTKSAKQLKATRAARHDEAARVGRKSPYVIRLPRLKPLHGRCVWK